jgi:Tfp pilus assembly protein PilF
MKDLADNTTRDLIDSPRRGRPPTGKAKTNAQVQKEYRQRKKAEGVVSVCLSRSDLSAITLGLAILVAKHQDLKTVAARYQELKDRLQTAQSGA